MKLSNFDSPKHFMSHPEDHQTWQGGKLLRIASKVIRVHLETRDQRPISRMLLKISMVMAETIIMGMVAASQHRQVRDAFRWMGHPVIRSSRGIWVGRVIISSLVVLTIISIAKVLMIVASIVDFLHVIIKGLCPKNLKEWREAWTRTNSQVLLRVSNNLWMFLVAMQIRILLVRSQGCSTHLLITKT